MTDRKKLPIGIDIFEKLDRSEFYYIDKTGMIEELLQNRSEVNLFTRPRRFGKSLNMSMLKTFFEIGSNPALFDGLKISENKENLYKVYGAVSGDFYQSEKCGGIILSGGLWCTEDSYRNRGVEVFVFGRKLCFI